MPNVVLLPPPDDRFIELERSRIVEVREISSLAIQPRRVPLWVPLTKASPRGSASWSVPNGFKFSLWGLAPHVAFEPVAETMAHGGTHGGAGGGVVFDYGTIRDRLLTVAMNCRVSLTISVANQPLIAQPAFPLSDLMSWAGDPADFFDCPGPVPEKTLFTLTASLTDTGATVSSTEYGVALLGTLLPTR